MGRAAHHGMEVEALEPMQQGASMGQSATTTRSVAVGGSAIPLASRRASAPRVAALTSAAGAIATMT